VVSQRVALESTSMTASAMTQLPIRLQSARPSDRKRSTPKMSAMAATGIVPTTDRVDARTMKPLLATPAPPLDDTRSTSSSMTWSPSASGVFVACARKTVAMVRYRHVPSRLNE
jgi:hypothetical protein